MTAAEARQRTARLPEQRRVVVTGVGLVSPLGVGTEPTWKALLAGHSGAAPITLFDTEGHPVRFAAEVNAKLWPGRIAR